MKNCIYPGSFDPITLGHLDIIKRCSSIFDKVYVALLNNISKKYMFTLSQRVNMINMSIKGFKNVEIITSEGLLTNLMAKHDLDVIIRGVRTNIDLEYEKQIAFVNGCLKENTETLFMIASPNLQNISSSIVKELILYGADITKYVPSEISEVLTGGKLCE